MQCEMYCDHYTTYVFSKECFSKMYNIVCFCILITSLECSISVGIVIIPAGLQATPGDPIGIF